MASGRPLNILSRLKNGTNSPIYVDCQKNLSPFGLPDLRRAGGPASRSHGSFKNSRFPQNYHNDTKHGRRSKYCQGLHCQRSRRRLIFFPSWLAYTKESGKGKRQKSNQRTCRRDNWAHPRIWIPWSQQSCKNYSGWSSCHCYWNV